MDGLEQPRDRCHYLLARFVFCRVVDNLGLAGRWPAHGVIRLVCHPSQLHGRGAVRVLFPPKAARIQSLPVANQSVLSRTQKNNFGCEQRPSWVGSIYHLQRKRQGATGLDQCRFSSKGHPLTRRPIKAEFLSRPASFAAGFFRRRLISPQTAIAASFFRRRRYPFTIPFKGFKPAEPLLD